MLFVKLSIRSSTIVTSTSSITLPSPLQMSRSGSNLKKRKLDLSPEDFVVVEENLVDFAVEDEEDSFKERDHRSRTVNEPQHKSS